MKKQLIRIIQSTLFLAIICGLITTVESTAQAEQTVQLTLPKEVYAVVGIETGIFFSNIVRVEKLADYQFEVKSELGDSHKDRWLFTPTKKDVGQHQLSVCVKDAGGKMLQCQSTKLIVVAANAGEGKKIRLLIVGDSLTHSTMYPNEIARLLSLPGNPEWEMLGTHKPGRAAKGVVHEGYGGWTWRRFNTSYKPDQQDEKRKGTSPFVFPDKSGKAELNLPKYFNEHCGGQRPDFITVLLGINDCFHAAYDDQAAIDAKINGMLEEADILIAAFRKAAPNAEIGICLTPPANSRDAAFENNYKGKYTREGWKKIQHQLVQQQLKHFAASNDAKLSVIPTELYLDITNGFPATNAVHPNQHGYEQIGSAIYSWLKWKLASTEK